MVLLLKLRDSYRPICIFNQYIRNYIHFCCLARPPASAGRASRPAAPPLGKTRCFSTLSCYYTRINTGCKGEDSAFPSRTRNGKKVRPKRKFFTSDHEKGNDLSFPFMNNYSVFDGRGRIVGNSKTSRIDALSVRSITKRSTPMPSPPVGGMPYSMAVR